jgi:talin
LGVTRESVIRVEPESKEVLRTWPLTTLRRWAATPSK